MAVTFTVDLEDPSERYDPDGRFVVMTRRILDLCDSMGQCKATFFVVGRVAEAVPQLVYEIALRGHEIAYHSHNHVSLTNETPDRFLRESREDKDRLEQLAGKKVLGFRAPRFSLTPKTMWALDVLAECGFRYSASIMPTETSLFGFPNAPVVPFLWPCGMIEFPLPVAVVGKYRLPYLGGIYLYTMPFFAVCQFLKKAKPKEVLWTYVHPYDFDRDELFFRMPDTPLWASLVLRWGRRVAARKIARLLEMGASGPLAERYQKMV